MSAITFAVGMALLAGCGGGGDPATMSADALEQKPPTVKPGNGNAPSSPTTPPASTTPAPVPTTDRVPLGVNIEAPADYARLQPFVDMMKTARAWGSVAEPWKSTVATDALGWPTTDAGVVVAIRSPDAGDSSTSYVYLQQGTYRLSFTGPATVASISTNVSVANYAHDQATNRSTADVVVGPNADSLMLTFKNTAGGVRDVSLRRPGYSDTQVFTNEFIQALAPFGTARLMDFLATNNNPVRTWAERTTPASATQTGAKGAAYEHAIQLANELGKDIWITIPAGADDDFVRQLATLLNTTLKTDRIVYIEFSNEVWNNIFSQTKLNRDSAVAEAIAGDTTLTRGTQCTQALFDAISGHCNPYWAGYFRVGKRTVRISQIFAEVFGSAAINTRVRVVLPTQFANPALAEQVLKNIATYRAKPSSVIYGVAGGPYFQLSKATAASTDATVDQILTEMNTALLTTVQPYFAAGFKQNGVFVRGAYTGGDATGASQKAVADYYGIKNLAYEGGPDLLQDATNSATKIAANRDPRMGDMLSSQLKQWFGCGNDLYMHYKLTSKWNQHGYWGLTNDPNNLGTAKYTAVRDIAQSARSSLTTCQ